LDDRTLTEKLFGGQPGVIFSCKILTFSVPKQKPNESVWIEDASVDGTARAEIIEVYFGKVDTNIIVLKTGDYMTVGKNYLIYTGANKDGKARTFWCGGNCDRWTKGIPDNPELSDDVQILKKFSDIFKNHKSGKYIFTNAKNIVLAEGQYKKGKVVGIWKQYYNNGKIKSETDYKHHISTSYYPNGFIKAKVVTDKHQVKTSLYYSEKTNGLQVSRAIDAPKKPTAKGATGKNPAVTAHSTDENVIEYYANGKVHYTGQRHNDIRIGCWQWFNENGTFNTEFDYKNGEGGKER
jgi:antitoxin component YwqK of YwqJK toxin-antitoxin module